LPERTPARFIDNEPVFYRSPHFPKCAADVPGNKKATGDDMTQYLEYGSVSVVEGYKQGTIKIPYIILPGLAYLFAVDPAYLLRLV
jgi:hypothetical protein